ncbi:MAG: metal-dependent phosphohydrolase [Treponema sp.]|nr:metal-dependent phosphohydrolase [Treponema sp.]
MLVKDTITPLSKVLSQSNEEGLNKTYIDIIINEEIPVLCINKTAKKKRLMPFKVLHDNRKYFWQFAGKWEYFFTGESISKIKEKSAVKTGAWDLERAKPEKDEEIGELMPVDEAETEQKIDGFGNEYKAITGMTAQQRVKCLNDDKDRLQKILISRSRDGMVITEALVDTTKDAAMINHATLEDAIRLADDEAKKLTQDMVNTTTEMVRTSTQLISEDIFSNELMNTLVEKSNGTIVQHMTRVYLNGIAFLTYYNNLVSTSSAIQKLRVAFASKFRQHYALLLPHVGADFINLERVFYGGMRAITPDLYFKWAVGFLVHDVGKASAVEYHEGAGTYDRQIVVDHVKQGYKSIMTKTNYPMEASLITGYHHEYYGDAAGYGYFRAYLQQYKRINPAAKQDYCITYELEPILDYQALAYFPAKVLEIIDVYDSLTDPNRVYREPMLPFEALDLMQAEFIEKHLKLDPILFHIFDKFIREKYQKS